MKTDLKSLLYSKVSQVIKAKEVQHFVNAALNAAPSYFWTLKASTSGKYHHGETLVEHILYAIEYGQAHVRMLGWYWDDETTDVFFAALFLHDLYRCGFEGREAVDEDGKLHTDYLHPIYAATELSRLEIPEKGTDKEGKPFPAYKFSWFKKFQKAVSSHMGPWSPVKELNPMHDNVLSLRFHVFLVDYVVSRGCQRTTIPELEE